MIVESAAKVKTITQYLKALYPESVWTVMACFGHIRDLPIKRLGVDTDTWNVDYEVVKGKTAIIKKLKAAAKAADTIYIATDPDLEGHAIAHHLQFMLSKSCTRVTFNEITKTALQKAVNSPSGWDNAKVAAQETRRILDRIVGYKVSPFLWKNVQSKTSAGRVQSAALAMVHKRFTEFQSHDPKKHWILTACFLTNNGLELACADCTSIDTLENAKTHISALSALVNSPWTVSTHMRITNKSPSPPYTTSSLQQDAFTNHRFNAKLTMVLAQALYEEGFITYMRTDSTVLSNDAHDILEVYIIKTHGNEYYMRRTTTAHHSAQEAHEAVRPTQINILSHELVFKTHTLTQQHTKLYKLIWQRTVASQMTCARYKKYTFVVKLYGNSYEFKGEHSVLDFQGYLKLKASTDNETVLASCEQWNELVENQDSQVSMKEYKAQCSVTKPKLLFTEAELIKHMEKKGIGRPSTYVSTIDKLLTRQYVGKEKGPAKTVSLNHVMSTGDIESEDITIGGGDGDRLVPQQLGVMVMNYLQTHFPELLSTKLTASMESLLDSVERKHTTKHAVLTEFYKSFENQLNAATA